MSLLTIYRVEDDQTKGPYRVQSRHTDRQAEATTDMSRRHTSWRQWDRDVTSATHPDLHPGPPQDYGMATRWQFMDWSARCGSRNYNFGFPTLERLGQWFFGERDTLELLNMHVAAYEVPHQAVIRGEWQLVFRRPSARLVETMPLKGIVE